VVASSWFLGRLFFSIKVVFNQGIRAVSFRKKLVKLGNVLIEIVQSRDPLYYNCTY
jgi:hypothetical protein